MTKRSSFLNTHQSEYNAAKVYVYMFENQRFRSQTKIDFQRMYMRAVFFFKYHLSFAMCNYECDV